MKTSSVEVNTHETEPPLWEQLFPREYLPVAAGTLLVVSVLFVVFGTLPTFLYRWTDSPKPNEIGDTFGFVNALFSGLGFAGLFITILIQIREFGLAQRERKEMMEQHGENVRIQEKISQQQHQSSLIQSVATFVALNPHRVIDRALMTEDDLSYLYRRAENSLILEHAQDSMIFPNMPEQWGEGVYRIRKKLPDQIIAMENCWEIATITLYMAWDGPRLPTIGDKLKGVDRGVELLEPFSESNGRDASESDIQFARQSSAYLKRLRSDLEKWEKSTFPSEEKLDERIDRELRMFKFNYVTFLGPFFDYTDWKS